MHFQVVGISPVFALAFIGNLPIEANGFTNRC